MKELLIGPTAEWGHLECTWARWLLPNELFDNDRPLVSSEEAERWCSDGFRHNMLEQGTAFCDGSGCAKLSPLTRPYVGAGVAVMRVGHCGNILDVGLAGTEVPGAQTAPRAELWATSIAAQGSLGGTVLVMQDSNYAAYGVHVQGATRTKLRTGGNGDLWEAIDKAVVAEGQLRTQWTK